MADGGGKGYGEYDRPHEDLREWIDRAESLGELMRVDGVDWNLEMGSVAEMIYHAKPDNPPAILFENIPGFSSDYSVLSGATNSMNRLAMTLGFPKPRSPIDVVQSYRDRLKSFEPLPARELNTGPVMENVDRDDAVDLYKFPVPLLHEEDGGRYFGTGDLVTIRDPEDDWVNLGTYRVQVHDRNTVGLWMSPGKHGRLIREKYFAKGEPCPVAISVGQDPLLFLSAANEVAWGTPEFAHAGGHRGVPFDITSTELHGLPMAAAAEIVLEGEILPDEKRIEGPFGEWTGYYASAEREDYVVKIRRVYHRDRPIHTMARPGRPPSDYSFSKCTVKAAMIWDQVERAGLPGVKGVWSMEFGGGRMFNVISIEQKYPGHARQALLLTAGAHAANYLGRFVVAVDDDIDPTSVHDVMWAIASRCDPEQDIDTIRRTWSGPLDPMKRPGENMNSRGADRRLPALRVDRRISSRRGSQPRGKGPDPREIRPSSGEAVGGDGFRAALARRRYRGHVHRYRPDRRRWRDRRRQGVLDTGKAGGGRRREPGQPRPRHAAFGGCGARRDGAFRARHHRIDQRADPAKRRPRGADRDTRFRGYPGHRARSGRPGRRASPCKSDGFSSYRAAPAAGLAPARARYRGARYGGGRGACRRRPGGSRGRRPGAGRGGGRKPCRLSVVVVSLPRSRRDDPGDCRRRRAQICRSFCPPRSRPGSASTNGW